MASSYDRFMGEIIDGLEKQRNPNDVSRIEELEAELESLRLQVEELKGELETERAKHDAVIQAKCPKCGRGLGFDGDCYGCEVDRLEGELAEAKAHLVAVRKEGQAVREELGLYVESTNEVVGYIQRLKGQLAASQEVVGKMRGVLEKAYRDLAFEFPASAIENIANSTSRSAWRARLALRLRDALALDTSKVAGKLSKLEAVAGVTKEWLYGPSAPAIIATDVLVALQALEGGEDE